MIRRLLFILFLYILLVWILAAYLYSGDVQKLVHDGLLWTAIGVAGLLLWLVLERVIGWWRVRRIQRAARPAPQTAAVQVRQMHEDDAALVSLLREADHRLAQAPGDAASRVARAGLPLYLVIGPERAGKTTVVQNSGVDAALLAGQVVGAGSAIAPTRVANLWLAKRALFLEVSGRVFSSDPARLAEFIGVLRARGTGGGWRRWLGLQPSAPAVPLRGVVLVCDSQKFVGTPEPSELDRSAQQIRDRLFAISGVVGAELPVYVLFTKADGVRYFAPFFHRLAEGDASQVFGVLAPDKPPDQYRDGVWAEAETRRLSQQFQSLFLRLNDRRLLALTQETKTAEKPGIYEFPREFKRIRTPIVQFLVHVFKPDPLRPGPRLRGFFFTGTRKTERLAGGKAEPKSASQPSATGGEATQILSPEMLASVIASPTVMRKINPEPGSGHLVDQWLFLTDFFHKALTQDRPPIERAAASSAVTQYQRILAGAATALATVLALVWTISWFGNSDQTTQTASAIQAVRRGSGELTLANLQALDRLRGRVEDLERDNPLRQHWGLYQGAALQEAARKVYFDRLKQLSLDPIDDKLVAHLEGAGTADPPPPPGPIYDQLKTHRTIAVLACAVESPRVSRVLKATAIEAFPQLGDEQRSLLDVQLDYYTSELAKAAKPLVRLPDDPEADEKARAYLRKSSGVEQQLASLLSELDRQIKPVRVADFADNYQSVLTGPAEFRGAFTKKGQILFEDLVAKGNFGPGGDACVMGTSAVVGRALDADAREQLKSLYYRQYAEAWRDFLGSFKVTRFSNAADAAHRLSILDGPTSPLLGIVRMVAVNTNFPPPKAAAVGLVEKGATRLFPGLAQAKDKAQAAKSEAEQLVDGGTPRMTAVDLFRLFQPVLLTTPPDIDRLVNDNDGDYVKNLRSLEQSLDALGRASTTELAAAIPQARTALAQARTAHAALADKFFDLGKEGVNKQAEDLLEQPITLAEKVIPANQVASSGGKKNSDLAQMCRVMIPILTKYPFSPSSNSDAALNDVAKGFSPADGVIWKYVQTSASELLVRQGQEWAPKPDLQGYKVAPELVEFLNRAQQLTTVFFSDAGMIQPKVKYVLRPVPKQPVVIKLTLDGAELNSQNPLQKTFYWPASGGATLGADGTMISGPLTTGFGHFEGTWGVFRLFQYADERPYGTKIVQWSEIRGLGGARPQPLIPPAKVEFVEFPNGVDLFNPKFFETLQCPKRAVIPN